MGKRLVSAIRSSGLTIYASLQKRLDLFLSDEELERILNNGLRGLVLDQPLRTRSKVLKSKVCETLGYPIPKSFKKTQPRFPGQNFDTYVQKSNNLQIWNEEVSPSRRYVLIRVDDNDMVTKVRVVTGPIIAAYDTTGALTQKYQARSKSPVTASRLVSSEDTANVKQCLITATPPEWIGFLPIKELHAALCKLVGKTFPDPGKDQERNRGGFLHDAVCKCLEGPTWADNGQFPDIKEQLLEVKLQTSATIDLGLVCPDSTDPIADMPEFCHCDVRYAVFYASIEGSNVQLNYVILSTGADFFSFFTRFGGLVTNKKLQIPLPRDFFG
jgi:hypothetical protein